MKPRSWKACLLLLAIPALGSSASMPAGEISTDRPFRIQEVRLTIQEKTRPFDFLLGEKIDQIVPARDFVAFRSGRELWVKMENRPVRTLDQLVDLPSGFDWYEHACAAGDRLVVAVSRYPEEQRLQEELSEIGEFRAGPESAGFLVVHLGRKPRATFLESLEVVSRPPLQPGEIEEPMPEVTLGMQSCAWDGDHLYVGDYGVLARVDLEAGTADLLEEDMLGVNRPALVKDGDGLWYAAFMDSPWMGKWTPEGVSSLGLEEGAAVDSLLKHRGRLLASSSEGMMEIDEKRRSCVRYLLPDDPAVYGLTLQHRKLLGVRDDGWVELDLSGKKAIHYRLEGPGADNRLLSVGWFDGDLYLGTVSGLVRVG
jgi:hypothetical protein